MDCLRDVLFTFGVGLVSSTLTKMSIIFFLFFLFSYVIFFYLLMSGGWLPLLVSRCSDRLRNVIFKLK